MEAARLWEVGFELDPGAVKAPASPGAGQVAQLRETQGWDRRQACCPVKWPGL